jgi:hypothetical protein
MKDGNFKNNKHVARTLDFTRKWAVTLNSHNQNALVLRTSLQFPLPLGLTICVISNYSYATNDTYCREMGPYLFLSCTVIKNMSCNTLTVSESHFSALENWLSYIKKSQNSFGDLKVKKVQLSLTTSQRHVGE